MKGVMYLTEIDKIITEMTDEEFLKVFKNTYEEDSKVKEVYSYDLVKDERLPVFFSIKFKYFLIFRIDFFNLCQYL